MFSTNRIVVKAIISGTFVAAIVLGSSFMNTTDADGNLHHRGRTKGFFQRAAASQKSSSTTRKVTKTVKTSKKQNKSAALTDRLGK